MPEKAMPRFGTPPWPDADADLSEFFCLAFQPVRAGLF
jgi:hypothetical protein